MPAKQNTVITIRQQETVVHAAKGLQNWQIAEAMKVSKHAVDQHLKDAYRRLKVSSRVEAAMWAMRQGLVK